MSRAITIRIPEDLFMWLASEAKRAGVSPGKIARDHLEKAKAKKSVRLFMQVAARINGPKNLSRRKGYSAA